ncbi:poly(3-hydroxyalkanoate) depolymerase [Mesorhizobium albiziae]|uniref:Poly(3-hydroxyalkanoate) depolymerase n=1 Tax=Neomesorhizobium albiziae TaxID=335020 RepID=A0A1I3XMK7_9HYPH|nr:poly(3-hydroxyalkanoate) depolymerase [Mesorhizobium albiziae]GLS30318.1 poly(3-hydroxyalkanoic acid) depolymerase [Mesorhizobium albiziae]SFK20718.1 poly(3-hydroxyalkanoate) depolymerase [Mesorhizobium albiziae]
MNAARSASAKNKIDEPARLVRGAATREMQLSQVTVYGSSIRVAVWPGDKAKTPLLLLNGIGASLELLVPFADALAGREIIAFDVPGTGESGPMLVPYRMWMLSMVASGVLDKLGYGQVDVLGVSWGGAFAQQFALQNPRRCRRLILAATSQGVLMVPPKLSVLAKFITPKRFNDASYRAGIAGQIYGGKARDSKSPVEEFRKTSKLGYLYQQLALMGWTSVPWLPLLGQPTLVMAGDDDPVIPLVNAKILAGLIRDSRLHVFEDGHLFLISSAREAAGVVSEFLDSNERDGHG